MRTLKSRLYEKMQDEKRSEMERFYGEKGEIAWGNQIRSYVFQPYQMVKDLRTGVESGNVSAVMDGDLEPFIHVLGCGPVGPCHVKRLQIGGEDDDRRNDADTDGLPYAVIESALNQQTLFLKARLGCIPLCSWLESSASRGNRSDRPGLR